MLLSQFLPKRPRRSFRTKLLAVVFTCTTVPMALLVLWLIMHPNQDPERVMLGVTIGLLATLVGITVALLWLYRLLAPVRQAAEALEDYDRHQRLPDLHIDGDDDLARLLSGINDSVRRIDAAIRELENHATHDPLTGAMNRRGCEQALAASVAASSSGAAALTLFLVDLDNLKPINDACGHATGDRALRYVIESATAVLGEGEWIGRWGGDEFLLALDNNDGDAVERMNDWIDHMATPASDGLSVQVSAGCAHYCTGHDALSLYRQADEAMYQAKAAGGRQLVCHGAMTEATA